MKTSIKKTLTSIGLIKSSTLLPRLKKARESDIFVISFPKSGNTWIRFLLANLLEGEKEITLKNINNFVPGIYNFRKEINLNEGQRYIKSHHFHEGANERIIYVYRDYRDVLISYFHYLTEHGHIKSTLSEFIRSKHPSEPFGTWGKNISTAIEYQSSNPDKILMIGYDQLMDDPISQLEKVISFCDISPQRPLKQVIENCSFSNLQKVEKEHGKVHEKSKIKFFRSGKSEQWKSELTQEDLNYIMTDDVLSLYKALNLKV
jgi:hypothetical protein